MIFADILSLPSSSFACYLSKCTLFLFRKIWCRLCFDSSTHCRRSLLPILCLCRYVNIQGKPCVMIITNMWFTLWGVSDYLFSLFVGVGGLSFLQFCNLNSFRNKFILGFSIFLGLSVPQYFNEYTVIAGYGPVHTHGRWV